MNPLIRYAALVTCFALSSIVTAQSKPANVVLIVADDLGWSDVTLYGTTKLYKTPNIERLAKRGMTFTRAHSASPLCSPTRASLLTGLSPARHGITAPNCHLPQIVLEATEGDRVGGNKPSILPNPVTRLDTKYPTLAKTLKSAGYATGHFGKWHLGAAPYSPLEHGFDVDVPHWPGPGPAGSFVAPWKFPDFDPNTPNEHIEDRMALEAVAFMEEHRDEPFFLNYWMFSVHAPFDAKPELIEQYRQVVDKDSPQRSPIYAAMIESMDDAVGTLLDTLDRLGVADNTIIVFTSDNGGNMYNVVEDTTATSNAPLRGGKATMYEGGTRVPQIVCWPGHVEPGSRTDVLTNSCDVYPTLLDMLSMSPADGQSFDGVSITPALAGKSLTRDAIFTYFPHDPPVPQWMPPSVSVHRGDWKLLRLFACGENGGDRWKLFNIRDDIGENHDLVAEYPEVVKELDLLIEDFLVDANAVRPIPNPNFDRSKYSIESEGEPGAGHFGSKVSKGQAPKGKAAKSTDSKNTKKAVGGWTPSGDCEIAISNHTLVITSQGGDPFVTTTLETAVEPKGLMFEFVAESNSQGNGQVFWLEVGGGPFAAARSTAVDMVHDAKPHTYRVPFSASAKVTSIRIDPSRAAGTIKISNMKLIGGDGKVAQQWTF